jgi:hypothetical protein
MIKTLGFNQSDTRQKNGFIFLVWKQVPLPEMGRASVELACGALSPLLNRRGKPGPCKQVLVVGQPTRSLKPTPPTNEVLKPGNTMFYVKGSMAG